MRFFAATSDGGDEIFIRGAALIRFGRGIPIGRSHLTGDLFRSKLRVSILVCRGLLFKQMFIRIEVEGERHIRTVLAHSHHGFPKVHRARDLRLEILI